MSGPGLFNPWDWALRALRRHRSELSLDRHEVGRDSLLVVLAGRSQEGKTALALRLLLGDNEDVCTIEEALRGGRGIGTSSTATVTQYVTSGRPLRSEDLPKLTRQAQEARESKATFTEVNLPGSSLVPATIVDLVGLLPAEADEAMLAREEAERWLDRADLILYVSALDHIADVIRPHEPHLRRLMCRWQIQPDSCLLVLSAAFETGLSRVVQVGASDPQELWNRVRGHCEREVRSQLARSGRSFSAQLPQVLPVFMKSGNDESERPLRMASDMSLEAIRRVLKTDPTKFVVRSGFAVPMALERDIAERQKEHERILEEHRAKIAAGEDQLHEARTEEAALLGASTDLKEKRTKLAAWLAGDAHRPDPSTVGSRVGLPTVEHPDELDDEKFQELAKGFARGVGEAARAAMAATVSISESVPVPELRPKLRRAHEEFCHGLDGAVSDVNKGVVDLDDFRERVWGFLWTDWEASYANLREHCTSMLKVYSSQLASLVADWKRASRKLVSDADEALKLQCAVFEGRAKAACESRRHREDSLERLRSDLERQRVAMAHELSQERCRHKRSLEYPAVLASEFRSEWNRWVADAEASTHAMSLLDAIARCDAVSDVAQQICQMRQTSP